MLIYRVMILLKQKNVNQIQTLMKLLKFSFLLMGVLLCSCSKESDDVDITNEIPATVNIKTIAMTSAGSLSTSLTTTELSTTENLVITGNIDARDFKTIRDNMPALRTIDLSGATVVTYGGIGGTSNGGGFINYPANTIPVGAFQYANITKIALPSSITSIGNSAFSQCSLTSIVIPSSVISIGDYTFTNCGSLTSVTLSSNLTSIGISAFHSCKYIPSITIPASVTAIGNQAFKDCTGLTSITFPSSVITIGGSAFSGCTSIVGALIIPPSVTTIESYAFSQCTGLTSISISSSVTSIGDGNLYQGAFTGCNCPITVEASNLNYSSVDGVLYNKDKTKLIQCPARKTGSLTIPSSVTLVGVGAFNGCGGLTSISIPASTTILNGFEGCTGLTSIYINNTTPPSSIGYNGCYGFFPSTITPSCVLHVPANSLSLYRAASYWKNFVNIIAI